ncbi:MAG: transcription termination/antitermination protein NusA [Spirochaetaceae bacterium]|nr:MAG: transcription termination/antitermination protein NusA [Spirochaetaceae bacterium]
MASQLADAIRLLVQEKGISEELIHRTIEEFLLAAYKKKFGTDENAIVRFSDEDGSVSLNARKEIVEDVYDPVTEIALEDALLYSPEAEIGDELLIEIDPKEFDRVAVQSAKQKAKQTLREIQKDTLYSEYIDKVGEMIIGYYQRERNGNIFVDLGKTEGLMPKRYQSPREVYRPNDRIKALIYEVNKTPAGLQIILSRTHTEFVRRIFELEVPEIYDKTVEIQKIVREPGYRTKIAVYSNREDVDPVGACVGLRGVRIQAIVRELEGEKIDILKYDNDPRTFIKNALSPAEVSHVVILDEGKRQALAVVGENQLSLAIGKQGLNVRLANRLVDWNIDVKTESQFAEMDISAETKRAVSALFRDYDEEQDEITRISELPDVPDSIVAALKANGVELIEELVALTDDDLAGLPGITEADIAAIKKIVAENIEIIEQEDEEAVGEAYDEDEGLEPTVAGEVKPDAEVYPDEDAETYDEAEAGVDEEVGAEGAVEEDEDEEEEEEEITRIAELPGIDPQIVAKLVAGGIDDVVDLVSLQEDGLRSIAGITDEDVSAIRSIIEEFVEIIEEEDE